MWGFAWLCVFSLFLILSVGPILLAWYNQERLIFIPDAEKYLGPMEAKSENPSQWQLPYIDIWTESQSGEKNHSWLMLQAKNSHLRPTIIFFHGNAGTVNRRLPFYSVLFKGLEVNVVASSYRGYGQSSGQPGEQEFREDAALLIRQLHERKDINASKLIVFGRSIGGAVAVDVALECPDQVRAVIVENTFKALGEVANEVYPPLRWFGANLITKLLRHKFDTASKIGNLKQSIMFISGDSDELVPPAHMLDLRNAATSAKSRTWVLVGQGTHNETWLVHPKEYFEALRKFIAKIEFNQDNEDLDICIGDGKTRTSMAPQSNFWQKMSTIFRAEPATSIEKKEL